jgi:hypothetical protein
MNISCWPKEIRHRNFAYKNVNLCQSLVFLSIFTKIYTMRWILFLVMVCASAALSAQTDIGTKSITVPKSSGITTPPMPSSSSLFNKPEPKPTRELNMEPLNTNFGKKPKFENPNAGTEEKLNKLNFTIWDGEDPKRNQYLGEIKTKSKIGRIVYRDYDVIDGDVIRIYVNGEQTMSQIGLTGEFRGFDIVFKEGTNTIEFESISEGFGPPNTAEIQVLDEQGTVIFDNGWAIANGFRASVDIIKE